jgi:hypothetical protein
MVPALTVLWVSPPIDLQPAGCYVNVCIKLRGVDKVFKTLAKLASRLKCFHSPKTENNWPKNIERVSEKGKTLARLASGFVFLLANHEFYSHLARWRVVIPTPVYLYSQIAKSLALTAYSKPWYLL